MEILNSIKQLTQLTTSVSLLQKEIDHVLKIHLGEDWSFSDYNQNIIRIYEYNYTGCGFYESTYYDIPEQEFKTVLQNKQLLTHYKKEE